MEPALKVQGRKQAEVQATVAVKTGNSSRRAAEADRARDKARAKDRVVGDVDARDRRIKALVEIY